MDGTQAGTAKPFRTNVKLMQCNDQIPRTANMNESALLGLKTELRDQSPRANYTGQGTVGCRRS
jgi:hypothetical protein